MVMTMAGSDIESHLCRLGEILSVCREVELLLIGGAAVILTKEFPRDIEDITIMAPTDEELVFVRTYLTMLRVPSRKADMDRVAASLRLVDAFKGNADV